MKWILTQDRETLLPVTFENIKSIYIGWDSITIEWKDDTGEDSIGTYHDDEQAKEVLWELMCQLSDESERYIGMPPCMCEKCRGERGE